MEHMAEITRESAILHSVLRYESRNCGKLFARCLRIKDWRRRCSDDPEALSILRRATIRCIRHYRSMLTNFFRFGHFPDGDGQQRFFLPPNAAFMNPIPNFLFLRPPQWLGQIHQQWIAVEQGQGPDFEQLRNACNSLARVKRQVRDRINAMTVDNVPPPWPLVFQNTWDIQQTKARLIDILNQIKCPD